MAQVTAYKHKLASIFSRKQPLSSPTPSSLNFLKFPYDIRVIVYSYLDTEPLLSPRIDCLGLYQSCRQIKEELNEIVYKKLQCLHTAIEKTPGVDLAITFDPTNPRHSTVTLPFSAFDIQPTAVRNPRWKREVLSALQPLFDLHINVLRIHISRQHCTSSCIPRHDTLRDKLELQDTMRHLLLHIGSLIDRQNHYLTSANPGAHDVHLNRIFAEDPGQDVVSFPHHVVRAQRICLSWDLRPTPSDSVALVGRMNEMTEASDRAPRKSWFGIKAREKLTRHPFPMQKSPERTLAAGYYLRDSEHLVGEVGISSPSRWFLKNQICSYVISLGGNESREGRLISSRRLGGKFESGLLGVGEKGFGDTEKLVDKYIGISVTNKHREIRSIASKSVSSEHASGSVGMANDDFEDVERMVDEERDRMRDERWARQDYEIQMAYIEEGIMIY
ncbi:hypothetical protein DE146DRAFT_668393 [Phaeosphaeria sp. MPI-PUGE-AT-0046c]|nr:hypothetical protein DE146DRAFT_668393 [Phaeosphaeria sp. MPI-PUGE-AT-0046c]